MTAGGTGTAKFCNRRANQPYNMPIIAKSEVITQYKTHDKDTGSSEVQVALLTARINHLTEHLRLHRKDFHSRRGLLQMASRRRKLLDYLKRHDLPKYNELLQKLNLRK
jgi:small subunit ribosomal protein S15